MGAQEMGVVVRDCMDSVGFAPISANIYGSVAEGRHHADSDVDVMCIVDEIPDERMLAMLERVFEDSIELPVNISWKSLPQAQIESTDAGQPVTAAIERGIHVMGIPISELIPNAVRYDESAAARRTRQQSLESVAALRDGSVHSKRGHRLAEILEASANAALIHHGCGRFKTGGSQLDVNARRLGKIIGESDATQVARLYRELEPRIERADQDTIVAVDRLVDLLIAAASDPTAPGASTLK